MSDKTDLSEDNPITETLDVFYADLQEAWEGLLDEGCNPKVAIMFLFGAIELTLQNMVQIQKI